MLDPTVYKQILEQYAVQRDHDKYDRKMRKLSLYERMPRLRQIDLEMSQIGAEIAKAILQNPAQTEVMMMELEQTLAQLKREKAALLASHNIPAAYLEIQHRCEKCKDTGFLETNERCTCFNQKLISAAYQMSNIEKQLESQNFNHFDLMRFSAEILPKERLTQRDNMKNLLSESEQFVTAFPEVNHLFFYGSSGLGKTYLCNCIAKALLDKGHSVIYQTPFSIIDILERKQFTDRDNLMVTIAYQQLFEADLLIIDDLGTETANTFTISEFYNIINARILSEKPMIISTNIKLSEIATFYNDRIDSRIKGHFKLLKFFGPDIRWEYK
ncbi:MAG: replication protein DnaC [Clostridiales bacterium]|jgi:DNA replication protein DnaC|nr:replication protein DnaC [Clostridiales bacterium]MDN5298326.1 replication protein DnaC [Clostridiales bacterium]